MAILTSPGADSFYTVTYSFSIRCYTTNENLRVLSPRRTVCFDMALNQKKKNTSVIGSRLR